jgi:hypothetical protein
MVLLKDGGHAQSLTQYHPAYHGLAAVRLGDTLGRLKLLN